jgi:hypothetical protein
LSSCGKATAPAQPSPRPIAVESAFGARTQQSFTRIAASAPPHTTDSIGTAHSFDITSSPKGMYVPAMRRKTPAWSRRASQARVAGFQVGRW